MRLPVDSATPVVCEGVTCTWGQFLAANRDTFDEGYARVIRRALEVHGQFTDGGGAWGTWSVKLAEPAS